MAHGRLSLLLFLAASGLSLASCTAFVPSRSEFLVTSPTVFRNALGETIKISTEGMLAGGHFYKANDCSNKSFNCFIYGNKVLLIAPKFCFPTPGASWRVGQLVSHWHGYDRSADVMQNHYGYGISYVFSEVAGEGIRAFAYDVSGSYHVAPGQNFYGNIPSGKLNAMAYYAPTGPALLPCMPKRRHG